MSDVSAISSRNSVPFVGQLEAARLAVVRAGERAFLVAEDFRLEQRVGQRGAVDGLEVRDAARAELVDHARDDFLARSGRSEDQHRDVRLGRGPDPLEDDQHLLVAADHFAEALHRRRLILGRDGRAALEERVEQLAERLVRRTRGDISHRRAADGERDPEVRELADAVLDVHPQPAERLHQRFDVEALFRPRAEVAQDAGAQRRLHQAPKSCFEVRRLGRARGRGRTGASGAEGQVIHRWRLRYRPERAVLQGPREGRKPALTLALLVVVGLIALDQLFHRGGVAPCGGRGS